MYLLYHRKALSRLFGTQTDTLLTKSSCYWLFSQIRSAWLSKFSPAFRPSFYTFYRFPSLSLDDGASGWTAGLHLKSMLISLRDTFASEKDLSHQSCVNSVSSSSRSADPEAESLAHFYNKSREFKDKAKEKQMPELSAQWLEPICVEKARNESLLWFFARILVCRRSRGDLNCRRKVHGCFARRMELYWTELLSPWFSSMS